MVASIAASSDTMGTVTHRVDLARPLGRGSEAPICRGRTTPDQVIGGVDIKRSPAATLDGAQIRRELTRCLVFDRIMAIVLAKVTVHGLGRAVNALSEWQYEGAPMQLHPGDLGWFWRFGSEATAAAVRTWTRDGHIVAVALLDGADLLRVTMTPDLYGDEELAHQLVEDITQPERGVLGMGTAYVEAPAGALVQDLLDDHGWRPDEPWTPLRRDLGVPADDPGVRIETIGPDRAKVRAAVQRASFHRSTFTVDRWHAMATGSPYVAACCLVAYDNRDNAVAATTVWSAGPGRPGLIEPLGVHRGHRGHGYGKAMTLAAAAALQQFGSSSAVVSTPSSNAGAVATYKSAGFEQLPETRDRRRDA